MSKDLRNKKLLVLLENENFSSNPPEDFISDAESDISESSHNSESELKGSGAEEATEDLSQRNKTYFIGKDKKTKWNHKPKKFTRTQKKNIIVHLPGAKACAKNLKLPQDVFSLFVNSNMVDMIIQYTNIKIETKIENRDNLLSYEKRTDKEEIYAVLGLVLIMEVFKSSCLSLDDL